MRSVTIQEYKSNQIGHFIDLCNKHIDSLTRTAHEKPVDQHLFKLFKKSIEQLSEFLSKPHSDQTTFQFPKSLTVSLEKKSKDSLEDLQIVLDILKGSSEIHPIPAARYIQPGDLSLDGIYAPVAIEDQQEIKEGVCSGIKKKIETIREQLRSKSKELEQDAAEVKAEKERLKRDEKKRKLDALLALRTKACTREGAIAAINEDPLNLQYIPALQDDIEIVCMAVEKNPEAFRYATQRLKNHAHVVKKLLQHEHSDRILESIGEDLLKNKEDLLRIISENEMALGYADEDVIDLDFLCECIIQNPMSYQMLSEHLRKDRQIFELFFRKLIETDLFDANLATLITPQEFQPLVQAYFLFKQNPGNFALLEPQLRRDKFLLSLYFRKKVDLECLENLSSLNSIEITTMQALLDPVHPDDRAFFISLMSVIVENSYESLSVELKDNLDIILLALHANPGLIESLAETYQKPVYIKLFLKQNPQIYHYLAPELRRIPSIAQIALSQDLHVYGSIPSPLNEDIDFIVEILRQESFCDDDSVPAALLSSFPESIRHNKRLILACVTHIQGIYRYLNEDEKLDRDYAIAALNHTLTDYYLLPQVLKRDQELLKAVIVDYNFPGAIVHADLCLQEDKEFLLSLIQQRPKLTYYLPAPLFEDEDFLYATISANPKAFLYLDLKLFSNTPRLIGLFHEELTKNSSSAINYYITKAITSKHINGRLLYTILQEHPRIALDIFKNPKLDYDLEEIENSVFLAPLRTFFLHNKEAFSFYMKLRPPQRKFYKPYVLNNELILDLIGHDIFYYTCLERGIDHQTSFIIDAIKNNAAVYDHFLSEREKENPTFKAARAISLPYLPPKKTARESSAFR